MDGERALWNLSRDRFPDWTEILDFSHVMEKLWIAGISTSVKDVVTQRSMCESEQCYCWKVK